LPQLAFDQNGYARAADARQRCGTRAAPGLPPSARAAGPDAKTPDDRAASARPPGLATQQAS
jgi:hypothetical protein